MREGKGMGMGVSAWGLALALESRRCEGQLRFCSQGLFPHYSQAAPLGSHPQAGVGSFPGKATHGSGFCLSWGRSGGWRDILAGL